MDSLNSIPRVFSKREEEREKSFLICPFLCPMRPLCRPLCNDHAPLRQGRAYTFILSLFLIVHRNFPAGSFSVSPSFTVLLDFVDHLLILADVVVGVGRRGDGSRFVVRPELRASGLQSDALSAGI